MQVHVAAGSVALQSVEVGDGGDGGEDEGWEGCGELALAERGGCENGHPSKAARMRRTSMGSVMLFSTPGLLFTKASHSPGPRLSSLFSLTSRAATEKVWSMIFSSAASGSRSALVSSFSDALSMVRISERSMLPVAPRS